MVDGETVGLDDEAVGATAVISQPSLSLHDPVRLAALTLPEVEAIFVPAVGASVEISSIFHSWMQPHVIIRTKLLMLE